MITKEQAVALGIGTLRATIYSMHESYSNHPQWPKVVRPSGRCKTWKTRPNEFRLPVKYGFYQSMYITERNAEDFTLIKDEAVNAAIRRTSK